MKILLLEDDPILSDLMGEYLKELGFGVMICMDGRSALEKLDKTLFDLLILDINVPGPSGLEVLRSLRAFRNSVPTILITAYQDLDHLKSGFESGCDDYIKKPFELEELEQRINNIRKHFHIETDQKIKISDSLCFSPYRQEISRGEEILRLSAKESQILHYLINHSGRVISADELTQNIWIYEEIPTDATLRVYIKNLRGIIGKERIQTIRGLGYYYE